MRYKLYIHNMLTLVIAYFAWRLYLTVYYACFFLLSVEWIEACRGAYIIWERRTSARVSVNKHNYMTPDKISKEMSLKQRITVRVPERVWESQTRVCDVRILSSCWRGWPYGSTQMALHSSFFLLSLRIKYRKRLRPHVINSPTRSPKKGKTIKKSPHSRLSFYSQKDHLILLFRLQAVCCCYRLFGTRVGITYYSSCDEA